MKIPRNIKIFGHKLPIEILNKIDEQNSLGEYSDYKIKIKKDLPQHAKEEILFHEIFEALNHLADLNMKHTVLSVLSEAFYQILKDGKLLKE